MENQLTEQPQTKKEPFLNIFTILGLVAILVFVGYIIFGKKITTKTADSGTATLSWSANTESDLAGYKIYYGTSLRTDNCPPGGYPDKTDVGKTNTPDRPSYTISNLENGKTYYFSVTSYDVSGNKSCFSDEMSKVIAK